jgi:lipoprotein-releasing system ATP-binding protein
MNPVLRAEGLSRRLDGEVPVTLVQDISLSVARGEFVAVMGPSGSGKSSLLYLLGLLDPPSSGQIWLDGEPMTGLSDDQLAAQRLARLGFVFQFHFLLPSSACWTT